MNVVDVFTDPDVSEIVFTGTTVRVFDAARLIDYRRAGGAELRQLIERMAARSPQ